jgi:hypothetical protein
LNLVYSSFIIEEYNCARKEETQVNIS